MGALWELTLQGALGSSQLLIELTSWTYWLSQFTVLGLALLWVYLRRHEHFPRFRNTILLANVIGLVGYVLLPTAPPRMFPDVRASSTRSPIRRSTTAAASIAARGEPVRRDASLHAADALIVGVVARVVVPQRVREGALARSGRPGSGSP